MNSFSPTAPYRSRGTVTLVALCFVTIMGITLAGYIAVCSRAMNMSNRTFHGNLSKQLAEAGVDEALRAFNKNDWSDWSNGIAADWTVNGTTATCTMTFPEGKFGQGVTGSVRIRVDNFNAAQLNSAWNNTTSYRVNDLIGHDGIWYRCIKNHSNITPPNWNYWVPESVPVIWNSTTTYAANDLIVHNERWYRCTTTSTNQPPATNPGSWTVLAGVYTNTNLPAWPWVPVGQELLYFDGSTVVRFTNNSWGNNSNLYAWRWRDAQPYKLNDVIYYNGVWYRSGSDHTSDWSNRPTAWATVWSTLTNMWSWNNFTAYSLNDVVYHSSTEKWYRSIKAPNFGQAPSDTSTYWTNTPLFSTEWDTARQYGQYDTVRYNGQWYLAVMGNSGTNPASNPDTWALAPSAMRDWSATNSYGINDVVNFSGVWYRCILAHSNQPTSNTSYWASTPGASYQWSASTDYTVGSYVCYGGVWYKCIAATTANANQNPNNTAYWTAAWANSCGVTTGAPVVYAEGTIAITGSPSLKTQLRVTIAPAPLFPNALGATTLINMPSSATVDSYDSTLGNYNQTTSPFSVASPNIGSAAVLSGGLTTSTAVTVTSARVNGYVAAPSASSSPYAPRWSYGSTAILTDVQSPTVPSPRVDLTRVSRTPTIPQFDIQSVTGGTTITLPESTEVHLGTPGATTPSVYRIVGNLDRDSSSEIIRINGPVVIYVTGQLRLESQGRIIISSTGSLRILFGSQLWVGGSVPASTIQNLTFDPKKCVLIGTSTGNTASSHFYWSTDPFYGVIYMPNAYVSTWTNVPIYGAISAKNIVFPNSGGALHYDTSLRHATFGGVDQPYTVTSWRELPITESATMP